MTAPRAASRASRSRCAVVATLVVLTGCGGSAAPPVEAVPALGSALERVDRAIAARQFARAHRQLDRLVRATVAARESGDLDSAQSEPILAAAASLAAELPRRAPASRPSEPDGGGGDGGGAGGDDGDEQQDEAPRHGGSGGPPDERSEEAEKRAEERQKEREKQREEKQKDEGDGDEEAGGDEEEKGGGNEGEGGDSGGNGPDDGHGN